MRKFGNRPLQEEMKPKIDSELNGNMKEELGQ
jgi:hypothetical protein